MASTQTMPYLDLWLRDHVTILSRIVWHYDSSGVQAKKYYGSMYEPIIFAVKNSKNYTFNIADIEVASANPPSFMGNIRAIFNTTFIISAPMAVFTGVIVSCIE